MYQGGIKIYELKFKKKQLNVVYGVIWIVLGLVWIIYLLIGIFVFKAVLSLGTVYMTIMMTLNSVLSFLLGKYYITLSSRTYIKIYDEKLEIHKGLLRKNLLIKFEDIEEVRWIGERIVIILMSYCSNKEVEIRLESIYLKDLDILLNNFSKNNKLVKKL